MSLDSFVGEESNRAFVIDRALATARPLFRAVVKAKIQSGARTKAAKEFLTRLLTCAAGYVSIVGKSDSPEPLQPREQARLLK